MRGVTILLQEADSELEEVLVRKDRMNVQLPHNKKVIIPHFYGKRRGRCGK